MRQESKNKITVISSLTKDYIINASREMEVKSGGPALWIIRALHKFGIKPQLVCGKNPAVVKIIIKNNMETGSIVSISKIPTPKTKKADCFIISTIGNEFNIKNVALLKGLIVLDIQGYARFARVKNKKFNLPQSILPKIYILKATLKELKYVNRTVIDNQKKRILLITKGGKGFDIFANNKKFSYKTKKLKPKDTIGAGDTLLTAFVVKFIQTRNIAKSGLFTRNFVYKFLKNK